MALVSKPFGDIITFTRGSGGGRYNAQGKYEWLGNDAPRFDYDPVTKAVKGLLIEEQRTNLLTYSEEFDNAAWQKNAAQYVVVPHAERAPDGVHSASAFIVQQGVSAWNIGTPTQVVSKALQAVQYTLSAFVKAKGVSTAVRVVPYGADTNNNATGVFSLVDGTLSAVATAGAFSGLSGTAVAVGGGWWRVSLTFTTDAANAVRCRWFPYVGQNALTGDGTSGLYIWGAQLEQGSSPTSYIPTKATFTARNSTATYFDSQGVLRTAAANVARYDHGYVDGQWVSKGLLLEGQSTNLLTQSDSFGHSSWDKLRCSVWDSQAIAPDGTITADKLIEGAFTGSKYVYKGGSVTEGVAHTLSVFAKAAERNFVEATSFNTPVATYRYDLTTGAVTATSGSAVHGAATSVGGGWWRLSITVIPTVTGKMNFGFTVVNTATGSTGYTGDGTSGIYIWGAQLEVGDRPTSYIPTPAVFTSRASTKTYFDNTGVMRTAAVDEAAIDHGLVNGVWVSKGLSVEGQSTNLLLQSEAFDQWGSLRTSVVLNAAVSPDTASTADKVVEDTSTNTHGRFSSATSFAAGTSYTFSVVAKPAGRDNIQLLLPAAAFGTDQRVRFNLLEGAAAPQGGTSTYGMQSLGNGWYRCWITAQATTTASASAVFYLSGEAGLSYTGDGTSGLYIWGAQLEAGNAPSSYIPTTTAQVTRAADVTSSAQVTRVADMSTSSQVTRAADIASVNDLSGWYRQDEGTFVVDYDVPLGRNKDAYILAVSRSGVGWGPRHQLIQSVADQVAYAVVDDSSTAVVPALVSGTGVGKAAIAFKKDDFTISVKGSIPATDTSGDVPTGLADLSLGCSSANTSFLNGHIKSIKYLPRRVSNDELKALSV